MAVGAGVAAVHVGAGIAAAGAGVAAAHVAGTVALTAAHGIGSVAAHAGVAAAHGAAAAATSAAHGAAGMATTAVHTASTQVANHVVQKVGEKVAIESTRAIAGDQAASKVESGIKAANLVTSISGGLPSLANLDLSSSVTATAQTGFLTNVENRATGMLQMAETKIENDLNANAIENYVGNKVGSKLGDKTDKVFDKLMDSVPPGKSLGKSLLPAQLRMPSAPR